LDSIFDPEESPNGRNKIQLIRTTHVPPYGYGKNYGWTKIIRLVSTPFPVAIADVVLTYQQLMPLLPKFPEKNDNKLMELENLIEQDDPHKNPLQKDRIQTAAESILRQIITFHARVSHVAAHTSLLTLDISSMQADYTTAFQNMINFMIYDNSGNPVVQSKESFTNIKIILDPFNEAINNADLYSSKIILSLWQVGILEDILREEMTKSHNLEDWPSQSLWDMRSYIIRDENSIEYHVAKAMVPDCQDENVRCTINKDICEVKAQVKCD